MKRMFILSLIAMLTMVLLASGPVSKEAYLIQSYTNGDVEIRAVGIYNSSASSASKKKADVKKNGIALATEDAKKAAVYYLLHSAQDPILQDGEARSRFITHGDFIYEPASLDRIVTYVNPDNSYTVPLNNGQGQKITKVMRVNRDRVVSDLTNAGIFSHGYAPSNNAFESLETEMRNIPIANASGNTPALVSNDPFASLDAGMNTLNATENANSSRMPNPQVISDYPAPANSRMETFKSNQTTSAIPSVAVQSIVDDICQNIPAGASIALMDVKGTNVDSSLKNNAYDAISNALTGKGYRVISKNSMSQLLPSDRVDIASLASAGRRANAGYVFDTTISDGAISIQSINTQNSSTNSKSVRY